MRPFECPRARRAARVLFASLLAVVVLTATSCSNPEKSKAEHVRRGEAFLKDRRFQEAALEFRNAIQIDDRLAAAHWGLAQAYEKLERYNEAFEELGRTVVLDPSNKEARFKLGTYYLLGSQRDNQLVKPELLEEAQHHAEELLAQDENFIPGHILLANVLALRGERVEALARLNRAIALDPNRVESYISLAGFYWSGGDAARAEETFKHAIELNSRASIAYVEYGKFLVQQNRLGEGEAQFRQAVEVDPENRDVRWVLASFYLVNNRLGEAEEVYKALADLDRDRPEGRAKLADFYASTGRLDEALALYQENARQFPDYGRGHYRIGELLLQKGDLAGASAQAEGILKKSSGDPDALLLRARIRLEQNKVKEAIADLKQVLDQEPHSQLALYFMSDAQYRDGQIEQARSYAGDLERFHPNFMPAKLMQLQLNFAAGDMGQVRRQASELLDKLKQTSPGALQTPQLLAEIKFKALSARGLASLQLRGLTRNAREAADHLASARADLEAARELWPNAPVSYTNLAKLAAAEGKSDEALAHYERALSLDATNYAALEALVRQLGAAGRFQDARARMDGVVSEHPENARLHFLKALAYWQGDSSVPPDAQTAEAELSRAVELDPDLLPAYMSLAEIYFFTGQHDRAVAEYRKLTERRPDNATAFTMMGMVEASRQNYEAAAESYRRALSINPEIDVAANNVAMIYADYGFGNADEAMRLGQEIVRRSPNNPGYADTLGWVYYKNGLYPAAVEQLQKAVSGAVAIGGDNSLYRYHLGMALAAKGDKPTARRELQKAIQMAELEQQRPVKPPTPTPVDEARRTLESL